MEREKKIEKRLREYPNIDFKLSLLSQKLERVKMKGSPRDISAVDFSKVGHGSGANGNAETILKETQDILNEINELEFEKQILGQILEHVKKEDYTFYKFIDLYYFKNLRIQDVSEGLGYSYLSKKTIYNIKNNLEKYLEQLLG